jgi:hypothetical protein
MLPAPARRLLRPPNRQAIAARETRVAAPLRAAEHAYRTAIERDAMLTSPEPTVSVPLAEHATDSRQFRFYRQVMAVWRLSAAGQPPQSGRR